MKLCQLIYRYIAKDDHDDDDNEEVTKKLSEPEESSASLMHLSDTDQFTNLNPDEKTRLLISLIDDIHDCADIMQCRSLAN